MKQCIIPLIWGIQSIQTHINRKWRMVLGLAEAWEEHLLFDEYRVFVLQDLQNLKINQSSQQHEYT